jgi:GNAT superfamily N-acetyltransferase
VRIQITPLLEKSISQLANFAAPIWHEHYEPIIGSEQVDYMLEQFQSTKAIQDQIREGYQYFEVKKDEQLIGYFAIQKREKNSLFISKFYLAKVSRGSGAGKQMLSFIETFAIESGCKSLDLTVNKHNPAFEIYLKLGFVKYDEVEFDIGQGYIMDDYVMKKTLG